MKLEFSRQSIGFVTDLDAKQFKQILRKILALLEDPSPTDSSLLKGYDDLRRADVGELRVVYRVTEPETVFIEIVDRRNDDQVYKRLERKKR